MRPPPEFLNGTSCFGVLIVDEIKTINEGELTMNVSDRSPPVLECKATIASNPDISGIGVLIAFFFQGFFAFLIGVYMYFVSGRWARLKSFPGKAIRHIIRTRSLHGIPSLVGEIHPTNRIHVAMMADMLVLMSDMQTLSGIALMIAALSQLSTLTAYHAVQVANIAWIPSQSHHLMFTYTLQPHLHMRHRNVRFAGIAVYGVLYTTFCSFTYANVRRKWDLTSYCFRACAKSYCTGDRDDRDEMMRWVMATMTTFALGYLPIMLAHLKQCTWFRPKAKYGWSQFLGEMFFNILGWQLITWSWIVVALNGVCQYRVANKRLLNDPGAEGKWGFGQVIAVASLLVVGFEFWITFVEYHELEATQSNTHQCACPHGKRVESISA